VYGCEWKGSRIKKMEIKKRKLESSGLENLKTVRQLDEIYEEFGYHDFGNLGKRKRNKK